jgi:integrase
MGSSLSKSHLHRNQWTGETGQVTTWSQINRAERVWRIPASNSKSKKVRSVPLNDSALQVLEEIGTEGTHEHLFVNRQTGKRYTAIHKVWGRLRTKAGLPHLRIHDLRHMYASFLVNSGRSLYEVQQILGHSDPSVTQRYAHLSSKSLQDAANSASLAIAAASGPTHNNQSH